MRHLIVIPIIVSFFAISCNQNQQMPKYIVTTKVKIKKGQIDKVLQLFKDTNPDLVQGQQDWIKATFSKNEATSTVMVQAFWKNKESYLKFSKSSDFQNTMKEFGSYFAGKPNVEISEILFEM